MLPFEDRIRATPAKVARILPTLGSTPFFDTVLVKTPPHVYHLFIQFVCDLILCFTGSQYRYRMARFRLIFELPVAATGELGQSRSPLAYVQWFTDLKATRHPSRMFEVSKVVDSEGRPVREVIPLSWIIRSCHLIPQWENDLVAPIDSPLDVFDKFLVNDFLDVHSYLSL